jgi:hypothetical protein
MQPTTNKRKSETPPLLQNKSPEAASVFSPDALLREARRQKELAPLNVPAVCILDSPPAARFRPRHALRCLALLPHRSLYVSPWRTVGRHRRLRRRRAFRRLDRRRIVRLRLPLFAQSNFGRSNQRRRANTAFFVVIDRALRDEGTSYHYAAPAEFADADPKLVATAANALKQAGLRILVGPSWTTDAPFRETAEAIESARAKGVLAVEMEAAALYTFAQARGKSVLCLAHVTNTMGQAERDFEKGESDGTIDAWNVLETIVKTVA